MGAEPFIIVATFSTTKGRTWDQGVITNTVPQLISTHLMVVSIVLGLYCFLVQSVFAITAFRKSKKVSARMRMFEIGVFFLIPLILTRIYSVGFMFFPLLSRKEGGEQILRDGYEIPSGPDWQLSYGRVFFEIIPENVTSLLALMLCFFAEQYQPVLARSVDEEKQTIISRDAGTVPVHVSTSGMAFNPLKLNSTNILMTWYNTHLDYPFPTEQQKLELVIRTGFTAGMLSL